MTGSNILECLDIIQTAREIVVPKDVLYPIRDPQGLPILGSALAGRATHLVTGDRDLLEDEKLIEWMLRQGAAIVRPSEFLPGIRSLRKEERP